MKRLLSSALCCAVLVVLASPASAFFSVSADLPVTYDFNEGALGDERVRGLKLAVTLPVGFDIAGVSHYLGFGVEQYTAKGRLADTDDFEHKVAMYDAFLDIPGLGGNQYLRVGGGVGRGEFEAPASGVTYDDAALRQLFGELGYAFAGVVGAHIGAHYIAGRAGASDGDALDLTARMWTLGVRAGF